MRRRRIEIKCGNCGHINIIKPPRKYLKKTWYIDILCDECGKMNYTTFYFGKMHLVRYVGQEEEKEDEKV